MLFEQTSDRGNCQCPGAAAAARRTGSLPVRRMIRQGNEWNHGWCTAGPARTGMVRRARVWYGKLISAVNRNIPRGITGVRMVSGAGVPCIAPSPRDIPRNCFPYPRAVRDICRTEVTWSRGASHSRGCADVTAEMRYPSERGDVPPKTVSAPENEKRSAAAKQNIAAAQHRGRRTANAFPFVRFFPVMSILF